MNTEFAQQQKQHAHGMIERLAPEKLSAVAGLLEVLLDPFDRALATAEIDDEPVTEEERRDIEASRGVVQAQPGHSLRTGCHRTRPHDGGSHQLQGPFVRKLVLTDQARADLAALDRATRSRFRPSLDPTSRSLASLFPITPDRRQFDFPAYCVG